MNRRIKKKIRKRLQSGLQQFDENKRKLCPIAKTYREIKLERKKIHESMIYFRHIEYQLKGYSYQLCASRRLRKDWNHAWSVKYENFKKEIDKQ